VRIAAVKSKLESRSLVTTHALLQVRNFVREADMTVGNSRVEAENGEIYITLLGANKVNLHVRGGHPHRLYVARGVEKNIASDG